MLFVLVAVLAAGWVWQQRSDRVEVLTVGVPVSAGSVIDRGDLRVANVAGVEGAIRSSQVDAVVGKIAAVALVPGQVLNRDMVTDATVPGVGERVVGLELDPGRLPGGLSAGDRISVLTAPPSGDPGQPSQLESPSVLADAVVVLSVGQVESGRTRLSVVVPSPVANRLAAFASAGRIAVLQAPLQSAGRSPAQSSTSSGLAGGQ